MYSGGRRRTSVWGGMANQRGGCDGCRPIVSPNLEPSTFPTVVLSITSPTVRGRCNPSTGQHNDNHTQEVKRAIPPAPLTTQLHCPPYYLSHPYNSHTDPRYLSPLPHPPALFKIPPPQHHTTPHRIRTPVPPFSAIIHQLTLICIPPHMQTPHPWRHRPVKSLTSLDARLLWRQPHVSLPRLGRFSGFSGRALAGACTAGGGCV